MKNDSGEARSTGCVMSDSLRKHWVKSLVTGVCIGLMVNLCLLPLLERPAFAGANAGQTFGGGGSSQDMDGLLAYPELREAVLDAQAALEEAGDLLTFFGALELEDGTTLASCEECSIGRLIHANEVIRQVALDRSRIPNEFAFGATELVVEATAVSHLHAMEGEFFGVEVFACVASGGFGQPESEDPLILKLLEYFYDVEIVVVTLPDESGEGLLWATLVTGRPIDEHGEPIAAVLEISDDHEGLIYAERFAEGPGVGRYNPTIACAVNVMLYVLGGTACGVCLLGCITTVPVAGWIGCLTCAWGACCIFSDRLAEALQDCYNLDPKSQATVQSLQWWIGKLCAPVKLIGGFFYWAWEEAVDIFDNGWRHTKNLIDGLFNW